MPLPPNNEEPSAPMIYPSYPSDAKAPEGDVWVEDGAEVKVETTTDSLSVK